MGDLKEGTKLDNGKVKHDLVSPTAINELAKVLTFGSQKYEAHNWRKGMKWSRILASTKRHLNSIERGEDYDPETGLLHAAHVMCNAMFLVDYYKIAPHFDDRPHNYLKPLKIGLDIDEIICNFLGEWCKMHNLETPTSWKFDRNINDLFDKMEKDGTINDFYLGLPKLIKSEDIPFEPHCYITSRRVSTEITEQWLARNGFPASKVYTVPPNTSKVDVAREAGIDIFVDDRFENFVELNAAGICTFLLDAPHNQRYDVGYKRIKSLKELI